jgi:hypothetical protein
MLRDNADPRPCLASPALAGGIFAEDIDSARAAASLADKDADGGGLPGAVAHPVPPDQRKPATVPPGGP